MLIRHYQPESFPTCRLKTATSIAELDIPPADAEDAARPLIFIWRGALAGGLQDAMRDPAWPLSVLDMLPESNGWIWEIAPRPADRRPTWDCLRQRVELAAGIQGPATGNAVATLRLRTYEDRDSNFGDFAWWTQNKDRIIANSAFGGRFMEALLEVLSMARAAGSILAVEQISVLLSKDPGTPTSTLAPTLHSDLGYGPLESAIASMLEPGFDEMGGAMFLPGKRMNELQSLGPITLSTLRTKLANEPAMVTGSGDIVIYSGMIGQDGARMKGNGVPHISPDRPGRSARLSLLMRHRSLKRLISQATVTS